MLVRRGRIGIARVFVEFASVDINSCGIALTKIPLIEAAKCSQADMVEYLLRKKADVQLVDPSIHNQTAFSVASSK